MHMQDGLHAQYTAIKLYSVITLSIPKRYLSTGCIWTHKPGLDIAYYCYLEHLHPVTAQKRSVQARCHIINNIGRKVVSAAAIVSGST